MEASENRKKTTAEPHQHPARDRAVDVLRGLTCFAMILVNTAGPVHPAWLAHPGDIRDPITFADTLFPCFLFTSGLASTHSRSTLPGGRNELRRYARIKRASIRALKLSVVGIAYHNLIPRLTGFHPDRMMDFSTYRIPSVLGRIGISSVVCALEPCLDIPPPILPGLLALAWQLIAGLRPLSPLHGSSQACLDRAVFGAAHLYQPHPGFDPEGLLPSLLTVPISALLGTYLAPLRQAHSVLPITPVGTAQLLALGILGSSLTGLLPSPASKALWTPTYVAQTAATSVLYWSFSTVLVLFNTPLTRPLTSALEMLGQRSLEIYLISASASFALQKIGSWDAVAHLLGRLLVSTGLANHDHHQRDLAVGVARSSLLGLAMIPVAKCLMHFGWKI